MMRNEQLNDPAYYPYRCREITAFIFREKPQVITLEQAHQICSDAKNDLSEQLYAILHPTIIKRVEYRPLRQVVRVETASEEYKQQLAKYWEGKYQVRLEEYGKWKRCVGLKFGQRVYDFPSNIIGAYLVVDETGPSKDTQFKVCLERKQLIKHIYDQVCGYPDCTTVAVTIEDVERQICQLDMENVRLLLALYQEGREKKRAED